MAGKRSTGKEMQLQNFYNFGIIFRPWDFPKIFQKKHEIYKSFVATCNLPDTRISNSCTSYNIMWYHYYTKVNLVLLFISQVFPNAFIHTCLFHNSVAIFTSYHTAFFMIPRVWSEYLYYHNQTPLVWWTHNLIGHYVPIIYLWSMYHEKLSREFSLLCSCVSAICHLSWTHIVHGGLAMNRAYLNLSSLEWQVLWIVAIISHMASGVLLKML